MKSKITAASGISLGLIVLFLIAEILNIKSLRGRPVVEASEIMYANNVKEAEQPIMAVC